MQFVNDWNAIRADRGEDADGRRVVPVFLDANTAAYSLHLGGVGSLFTIRDGADQTVTLEVAGLLKNSVLQGKLMMSEKHFLQLFPEIGGYQFFCIEYFPPLNYEQPEQSVEEQYAERDPDKVSQLLESNLADFGFDAVDPIEQLAAFTAVQNTYLSTFQSLGRLGLLLGTVGLAAVQLRSVLERRGEFALMRAGGFPRARLMRMVILENAVLSWAGWLSVASRRCCADPAVAAGTRRVPWAGLACFWPRLRWSACWSAGGRHVRHCVPNFAGIAGRLAGVYVRVTVEARTIRDGGGRPCGRRCPRPRGGS